MRMLSLFLAKAAMALTLSAQQASALEPWITDLPASASSEMQGRLASEFPPFFGFTGNGRADGLANTSFEYAEAMGARAFAPIPVIDAIIDHLRLVMAMRQSQLLLLERFQIFKALLAYGQCEEAHQVLWNALVDDQPYLAPFSADPLFLRRLRWQVYGANLIEFALPELIDGSRVPDFRNVSACWAAESARLNAAIITDWANASAIPDRIQRPFASFPMLINSNGSVHGARDGNVWHLIHMATQGEGGGYGPAGVMLVELALELDGINLPDDILHMLLLRAEATWPASDSDRPLPVSGDRIAELLPAIAARLSADDLAYAQACFLTNESYQRLFLGDEAHFAVPATARCVAPEPN